MVRLGGKRAGDVKRRIGSCHDRLHTKSEPSSLLQIPVIPNQLLSFAHHRPSNTREVHSITYLSTARAPGIAQKHRVQIHHLLCLLHRGPLLATPDQDRFHPTKPFTQAIGGRFDGISSRGTAARTRRARARGSAASHTKLPTLRGSEHMGPRTSRAP